MLATEVTVIPDACHMLKLMRNALADIKACFTRWPRQSNKMICRSHFRQCSQRCHNQSWRILKMMTPLFKTGDCWERSPYLLKPFADETNKLQSDAQSLSSIVPSLLNLEAHLEQWQGSKELAKVLIRDFRNRFDSVLQPDSREFQPWGQ